MKTELRSLIQRMVASAGPIFRRFWASVGFTVVLTATLISYTLEPYREPPDEAGSLSLALVAGLLASWCAILLWEQGAKASQSRSALTGNFIALVSGSGITWATFAMLQGLDFVALSRHIGICVFLFLLFFAIPNWRNSRGLDMYVVRLFTQAVVAVLFSAVLFMGLAAITAAVDYLFSLDLSHRVYLHTWFVMAGTVAPFLFMAGIPEPGEIIPTGDYPKVLSNLIVYVVTPVLTVYTFILYLYFAKILITWQWPVGLVGHLVLWYAVFTTATLLFTWPLAESNKWAKTFSRYFPWAVIPLLAMMFASLGIRIKHYGITENRYYVLVLGSWLLGIMLHLNLSKSRKSIVIPVTLAIVALLSVIGPWSSFSVSKWSQNRRLEAICTSYGMVSGGMIQPSDQVAPSDRREILAIIQYFDIYHDLSDIALVPEGFTFDRFEDVFGFSYTDAGIPTPVQWFYYEGENWSADITEYDYLFDFARPYYEERQSLSQDGVVVTYEKTTKHLSIALEGQLQWQGSFTDYVKSIQHKYTASGDNALGPEGAPIPGDRVADGTFRPEDMVFEALSPKLRVKIVITSIRCQLYQDGREPEIYYVGFFALVERLDR